MLQKKRRYIRRNALIKLKCGVVFVSEVVDIIRILDNAVLHEQIEIKDGLLFMRMKKRSSVTIR